MIETLKITILFLAFWASGVAFVWPMEKKKNFQRRMGIWGVIILGMFLFSLYVMADGRMWTETVAKNMCQLMMIAFLYTCWDISLSVAVYNTVWASSVWQLILEVEKIIKLFGKEAFEKNAAAELLLMIFLYIVVCCTCAKTIAKWMENDRKKKIGPRQMVSALMLFTIIEMLSYAPALQNLEVYDADWKFLYLSQLMCVLILYLQNELFKKSEMKQELQLMNLLWKKEQEQYQLTKDNIALLNQKSHDLKHHIKALRQAEKKELDKYLDELEDVVLTYDAIVKTGNDVFDTILSEKSLHCMERKIQVSCVADGSQMNFINTVDLYALLGNAMDNAIEAVEKFQEVEKRQIDVIIYRQNNFLVMNIINPIPERLVYDEEFPITTKGDKKFHGFGLRSMQYIVRKYDGFLNISEEDGCFSLKILIPIPSEEK